MKILSFFVLLLPFVAGAQTKADYEQVMAKFQRFYNAGQGDSIRSMSASYPGEQMWTNEDCASVLEKYGMLKSFKFLGIDKTDPDSVYVFQTFFSKAGANTTSLTLDENSRLGTFRFITTSEGIDALLKKRKASRQQ